MVVAKAAPEAAQAYQPPVVDSMGRTTIDPTVNVKEKIEDTVRRLDDLSSARERFTDSFGQQRRHYEGLLREAENHRRIAERDRLDAIRIIDVTSVTARAAEANERANALATAQANQAEALRAQVAATAVAFEQKITNVIEPIQKRLEELSRVQYEQQGSKAQVVEARESAGDLKPILEAISSLGSSIRNLQDERQNRAGSAQQVVATRDNTRFAIALGGAAIIGLQLYNAARPGG